MAQRFDLAGSTLSGLKVQAGIFSTASIVFTLGGFALILSAWDMSSALRWLGLTLSCIFYLFWILWRGLPENHRDGENDLLPNLGAANLLTLVRGLCMAAVAGFLFSPRPEGWLAWLPGALYTLVVAADGLDGYLARVTNHSTRLGEILDLNLDGLGVLAAAGLAVQWGQAPWIYLVVAFARYGYTALLWLWRRKGRAVRPLPYSVRRRAFAGLQMGLLVVLLWPVFGPPGTQIAAVLFAIPFLAGFAYDWLYATGLIGGAHPSGKVLRKAHPISRVQHYLPLALRLVAVALGAWQALTFWNNAAILPGTSLGALLILEALVLLLILLGAAGRVAAIAGLLLLGVHQIFASLSPLQIALAGVYIALLYLGTGAQSLWKPEDRLIYRRLGERT